MAHPDPVTPARPPLDAPVGAEERLLSLDALRGVALMGILIVNLPMFAYHPAVYYNPPVMGGFSGANFFAWLAQFVLCELKMMSIFSMLFGAGIAMFTQRAGTERVHERLERPRGFGGVFYRRMGFLALAGIAHAWLLWFGDILFVYALCGMILYAFRTLTPRTLLIVGSIFMFVVVPVFLVTGAMYWWIDSQVAPLKEQIAQGKLLAADQHIWLEAEKDMLRWSHPTPEQFAQDNAVHLQPGLAGYLGLLAFRAELNVAMQVFMVPMFGLWRCGGMMLIGMALFKNGFLTGAKDARVYLQTALIAYAVGLPLVAFGAYDLVTHDFEMIRSNLVSIHFNYVGSIAMALGHASLVLLAVKKGLLSGVIRLIADAGRMAFTNYLTQTLICTTLFYGYGFALYGQIDRAGLWVVWACIVAVQLIWSRYWLRAFRMGPLEWLWRCATYLTVAPLRRSPQPRA
jgi:uncharacterized protein